MKCSTQRRPAMITGSGRNKASRKRDGYVSTSRILRVSMGYARCVKPSGYGMSTTWSIQITKRFLGVGAVCSGNMEEDYAAALKREKRAQSIAGRRARWMNARWRISAKGNSFINRNGFNIVVSSSFRGRGYLIRESEGERSWRKSGFVSENDAKLAAFECFVEIQE